MKNKKYIYHLQFYYESDYSVLRFYSLYTCFVAFGYSTSLADVRFNVTVEADENADLYSGQSVNVYFNYSSMKNADFSDFKSDKNTRGEGFGSGGGRPDFGGGMPEGFDPSNMPDFSRRKED